MPAYTQASRPVRIATPLGEDTLLLRKMVGREELGRLFQFEVELLSENHEISYSDIIGQNVTIAVERGDDEPRFFNACVSRFALTDYSRRFAEYRATLVPWLWFLTRSSDCRVFQGMTLPDILKKVFQDHGFQDIISNRLHETYAQRDYTVQYRETAFNFVSRLMEQEGIYYFFQHENGKHNLVLCDDVGSHHAYPGYEELHFHLDKDRPSVHESIWGWVEQHEVQPGTFSVRDYDFQNPRRDTGGTTYLERRHAGSGFEQFDYLGEMDADCDPDRYSRLRLEQAQAGHALYLGEGDARGISPGFEFRLKGHPRRDSDKEYLTIAADYRIESNPLDTGQAAVNNFVYEAKFSAVPAAEPFRSRATTPKPRIQGPQTAVVVGYSGEEIHTDKYGRVKVQFHWDRYGKADENSSCWVRVAQVWAGKKWGAVYLPRIGQEVIVEFLEGDPDRPIITGSVYNEREMPPYDLPGKKTISTVKSNSTKDGSGFNEIRFEDSKGEEQLFIHAEKNQDLRVKSDSREFVGNERHLIVKTDQLEKVEGDKHGQVKGDYLTKVEGDRGETIQGDHLVKVDGGSHLTVSGDLCEKVAGDANSNAKNLNIKTDQKLSVTTGAELHTKSGTDAALESGMGFHIKAGLTCIIEAGAQLSLKVGGNFIDINPGGVFIQGSMVMINSGGAAGSGAGSSPTAPAAPQSPDPPKDPKEAATADPGQKDEAPVAPKPPKPKTYSASATVLKWAAQDGTPFCEKCEEAKKKQAAAGRKP